MNILPLLAKSDLSGIHLMRAFAHPCDTLVYLIARQVLPVNPTLVATTPEAQPNWASGNQNQDIPNHAFSVFMATSENKHFLYV